MTDVTSMDTKIFCRDDNGEPKYEVNFDTHNRAFYEKVVAVCRECIDNKENIKEDIRSEIKESAPGEKFDIVEAFMHLIWGRKVRMTHWDEGEYIKLAESVSPLGAEYLCEKEIINQAGGTYPAQKLFDKSHIEAKWEDYKE